MHAQPRALKCRQRPHHHLGAKIQSRPADSDVDFHIADRLSGKTPPQARSDSTGGSRICTRTARTSGITSSCGDGRASSQDNAAPGAVPRPSLALIPFTRQTDARQPRKSACSASAISSRRPSHRRAAWNNPPAPRRPHRKTRNDLDRPQTDPQMNTSTLSNGHSSACRGNETRVIYISAVTRARRLTQRAGVVTRTLLSPTIDAVLRRKDLLAEGHAFGDPGALERDAAPRGSLSAGGYRADPTGPITRKPPGRYAFTYLYRPNDLTLSQAIEVC